MQNETRINTCHHCGKYDWACAEGIRLKLKELTKEPYYQGRALLMGQHTDYTTALVSATWLEKIEKLLKLVAK